MGKHAGSAGASFNGPYRAPTSPTSYGIYGQRYVANSLLGTAPNTNTVTGAFETEFAVNTTKDGDQCYPSIAMDSNGDFLVVWSGYGVTTTGQIDPDGVYMQRFDRPTKTTGATVAATYDIDQSPEAATPAGPANLILVSPPPPATNNVLTSDPTATPPVVVQTFNVIFTEPLSVTGDTVGLHSITNPNNWSLSLDGTPMTGGIYSVQFGLSEANKVDSTIPADGKWEAVVQFDSDPNTAGPQPLAPAPTF